MNKKILHSLLSIFSLFMLTGCWNNQADQINKINDVIGDVDNLYINGGGSSSTSNQEQPNGNTQENKKSSKNSLLVGIWQTDVAEYALEKDGQYYGALGRNFYIFNSDGTWDYVQIRIDTYKEEDIYTKLNEYIGSNTSTKTYSYDGKEISFGKDQYGDDIKTELKISGNSFKMNLDYCRYLKEDGNMQVGKFEKYR